MAGVNGSIRPAKGQAVSHVESEASAWRERAADLASWSMDRLRVRSDHYGQYRPLGHRAPGTARTVAGGIDLATLRRHFEGRDVGHLVGLHVLSADGTCRWVAWDIDAHDGDGADPAANLAYAETIRERLAGHGIEAVLTDSNGAGGYHVLVLVSAPIPAADAVRLASGIVADCQAHGVARVETFPRRPKPGGKGLGPWLRLPGRHHTRAHWTRVRAGSRWLAGCEAIEALLGLVPASPETVLEAARTYPEPGAARTAGKAQKRPTEPVGGPGGPSVGAPSREEVERVREALGYLDPDMPYPEWLDVGLSLSQWGDTGLSLWDEWSSVGAKYKQGECEAKWGTMRPDGGRGIGSIIVAARAAGWRDPWEGGRRPDRPLRVVRPDPESHGVSDTPAGPDDVADGAAPDMPVPRDGERRAIEVGDRVDLATDAAIEALATVPDIYCRAGRLVRVVTDRTRDIGAGIMVPLAIPRIVEMTPATIPHALGRVADLYQWRASGKGEERAVIVRCPAWLADTIAEIGHYPGVRSLSGGLADAPYPRPDGTIVTSPGYDADTETVLVPSGTYPTIPDRPTGDDARAAVARILSPVDQFPWAGDCDRGAWLALVLSLIARPAIVGPVPGFLVTANTRGSGKTLLLTVAGIIGCGYEPAMSPYPNDPAESDKVVLSAALAGLRMMCLDNVPSGSLLGNAGLDRAITARTVDGRELGRSRMVGRLPHRIVWAASGNNVTPSGDSARRWIPIRLETALERPEVRDDIIIRDLPTWVREHRTSLVADCLTILRGHAVAGYPGTGKPPLGSFEAWDRVIRGAVAWAYGIDPTARLMQLAEEDPERAGLAALLSGWRELQTGLGRSYLTVAEVLTELEREPQRYESLRSHLTGRTRDGRLPAPSLLGRWVGSARGRTVAGMRLDTLTLHGSQVAYGVREVEPSS